MIVIVAMVCSALAAAFGWFCGYRHSKSTCMHHSWHTGTSWIESRLIDLGRRKMFWCTRCGRTWFS